MPSLGPGTLSACSGRAVSMNVLPVVPLAKREPPPHLRVADRRELRTRSRERQAMPTLLKRFGSSPCDKRPEWWRTTRGARCGTPARSLRQFQANAGHRAHLRVHPISAFFSRRNRPSSAVKSSGLE